MTQRPSVIALGLDAMEGLLVERLLEEGRMPNLARLRERGAYGRLRSRPAPFLSMVWPTFYTGQTLGSHGWYYNKLWSAREQLLRYVDPSWLPVRPFWDDLSGARRVTILDVPCSAVPDDSFSGTFLNGWQAHDNFGKFASTPGLHRRIRRQFGNPAMRAEMFGPQDVGTLQRQREQALTSLAQFASIVADMLTSESHDLLLAVFGGVHRGTHYLWSLEEADTAGASAAELEQLSGARDEIYQAADRAVGAVLSAVPADSHVLVFALHGMGRNHGWGERFFEIVRHLHGRGRERPPRQGAVYRIKRALPWRMVRQVTGRLPPSANHALVPFWSRGMLDWSSTRYFALPTDQNGYIRINQRGRERQGIVNKGPELEALIDEVTHDLLSLRDLRDDQPIVAKVHRIEDLVGGNAPTRDVLPDLVIDWTDTYAHGSHGVRSRYGEVRWSSNDCLPSGRSGNHIEGGWLVASGPGVAKGAIEECVDSIDLVPTLLQWMGAPIPDRMEGSPLIRLVGDGSAKEQGEQATN